ncbi:hypothetical protein P3L10_019230 [Capsicum annuum]
MFLKLLILGKLKFIQYKGVLYATLPYIILIKNQILRKNIIGMCFLICPDLFLEVNLEGKVSVINFVINGSPIPMSLLGFLTRNIQIPLSLLPPYLPLFGDAKSKAREVVGGERIYSISDKPKSTIQI